MNRSIAIVWFRQDLRLHDNPALSAACQADSVLPIYILDDEAAGRWQLGAASRAWLHEALRDLHHALAGSLALFRGKTERILAQLLQQHNVTAVYWNRCYEPWRIQQDKGIKQSLTAQGIAVQSFNGSLLWEPWQVRKSDGTAYKVFTPFYRKGCLQAQAPRAPASRPDAVHCMPAPASALTLEQLDLLPRTPWHQSMLAQWHISESAAQVQLTDFIATKLANYKEGRNFPGKAQVSQLSPYLHFGQISPHQVWAAVDALANDCHVDHFKSELGWREFSYHLLYHFPTLPHENLQAKFNAFAWQENRSWLQRWQQGQTGYPIVDAGMRQLWQTGYMHNRVRMIVGSFLVKNLRLHWHHGQDWFWDCLVDADLANNSAGWQWIAGCGADAAPYFRIFNPLMQGQKFDPDGQYTLQYVPELAGLPLQYLFCPWQAPADVLAQAHIVLGETYPHPIVDLQASRQAALDAFASLKNL